MPVRNKDHRGVPMAVAVAFGSFDEPLDLGLGEVLARPQLPVGRPSECNCSIFGGFFEQCVKGVALEHPIFGRASLEWRSRTITRQHYFFATGGSGCPGCWTLAGSI